MRSLRLISAVTFSALSVLAATPAGANPIMRIAPSLRAHFTCVIWHEPRSTWGHLNLGDNTSSGASSGIFQIVPVLWDRWAPTIGIHVPVWRASVLEQERVAVQIMRHDGF